MNLTLSRPFYNKKEIHSISSLTKGLKVEESFLSEVLKSLDTQWRTVTPEIKPDGSIRELFDAKPKLKLIHERICKEIFTHIVWPPYITGGVKQKDSKTNAELHTQKTVVFTEDIKSFYPNIKQELIYKVWRQVFKFSHEVSEILTQLTTKGGCLPQGGKCSTTLANLVLFDVEPSVYDQLVEAGYSYSRFIDDITVSTKATLSKTNKKWVISKIYAMLASKGFKPKRSKHEIHTQKSPMLVTKLVTNKRASMPKEKRHQIRSAVYQIERRMQEGQRTPEFLKELRSVTSRVGQLGRYHKTEAQNLKCRLKVIQTQLKQDLAIITTYPTVPIPNTDTDTDTPPF